MPPMAIPAVPSTLFLIKSLLFVIMIFALKYSNLSFGLD
jgi:hypothetical protein